jgi:hypothetical protein
MDPTPWKKFREKNDIDVLGHFRNVYGERYVIYRMTNGDVLYISGDENDWALRFRLIGSGFIYNDDEREMIAKILWPTMNDGAEILKARESGETLRLWRPWEDTPEPEIVDG